MKTIARFLAHSACCLFATTVVTTNLQMACGALLAWSLLEAPLQAQGITYWSNLDAAAGSSVGVGADAWFAERLSTGIPQAGHYRLNSVQVKFAAESSSPDKLRLSIHSPQASKPWFPGAVLGNLSGPEFVGGNVATFTASTLSLEPAHSYFLVFSSTTPLTQGAVSLSTGVNSRDVVSQDGWQVVAAVTSTDGLDWERFARNDVGYVRLAIDAALIPEPSSLALCVLGALLLLAARARHIGRR